MNANTEEEIEAYRHELALTIMAISPNHYSYEQAKTKADASIDFIVGRY